MDVAFLGSSSSGNSTLVCNRETRVLIDAGLSARETERRLSLLGYSPGELDGVLLSHEHTDHCRGAGILSRKHGLPIFANPPTYAMAPLGAVDCRVFRTGEEFRIGDLRVNSFPVMHNAAEPVCFSVDDGRRSLGFATDLGKVTPLVASALFGKDIIVLEANHDERMLWGGTYPEFLKRSISSSHGHLSNRASATAIARLVGDRTRAVVLAHLSEENNTPERALHEVGSAVARRLRTARVVCAERFRITPPISLD